MFLLPLERFSGCVILNTHSQDWNRSGPRMLSPLHLPYGVLESLLGFADAKPETHTLCRVGRAQWQKAPKTEKSKGMNLPVSLLREPLCWKCLNNKTFVSSTSAKCSSSCVSRCSNLWFCRYKFMRYFQLHLGDGGTLCSTNNSYYY